MTRPRSNHLFNYLPQYRSSGIKADSDACSIASELTAETALDTDRSDESEQLVNVACAVLVTSSECNNQASRKRRVRFDFQRNIQYENHVLCQEECPALWYSGSEQQQFRESASMVAKTFVRCESQQQRGTPGSFTTTTETVFRACLGIEFEIPTSVLTRNEERAFRNLFTSPEGWMRMGLERRMIRCIAKDKTLRRRILVDIVYELQDSGRSCVPDDAWAEQLREECEAVSLASRLFARHLAQAQAAAALVCNTPIPSNHEETAPTASTGTTAPPSALTLTLTAERLPSHPEH